MSNSDATQTQKRRIAMVDDHTMLREGLQQLVDSQSDLTCCSTASNTQDALRALEKDKPDLLAVDISMPGRNGLELIKDALTLYPDLAILVISMHDEGFYAQRVLKAGARGYVMKDADGATLLHAMRTVLNGGRYLSPAMSEYVMDAFSGKSSGRSADGVQGLSDREFEVFQLLGEGKSTEGIAEALNISPKTVEVHRAHIRDRLKLENGAAVVRYAVRWVENQKLGVPM
ncbi:response regulator transcription factor [Roseimicrobium sp. ORNL1]|uniref:response regulator n=1 Tax=Roseimicrobium sp. ORNL1 TaxID=2711231 RepID=UPI0013E193EC|nr:response regulator transcription factor [Roseimicrobium sp. ORNL1]QIF00570.1 response regulator transcription factor [Roseimicrobium sp. ORNL1]